MRAPGSSDLQEAVEKYLWLGR